MILLYFILDCCFYNFTKIQTNLIILPLLEKKNFKSFLLWILLLDFLLSFHFRFFLIYLLLYIGNKKICLPNTLKYKIGRFFILYSLYLMLCFLTFKTFHFSIIGIGIDILFLFIESLK